MTPFANFLICLAVVFASSILVLYVLVKEFIRGERLKKRRENLPGSAP